MIVSTIPLDRPLLEWFQRETGEEIAAFPGEQAAADALKEAGIVISSGRFGEEALARCENLKLLYTFSAGVDRLPFESLKRRGIRVANASGIHAEPISEYMMSMILHFHYGFRFCERRQAEHVWRHPPSVNPQLRARTLCVVGAGSIGQALGRLAKFFGMRVIGVKRHPQPLEYFDEVTGAGRLCDALRKADYVAIVTPLTEETYHLIGKAQLAAMKDGAVLINVSRGDTVDEPALIEALQSGRLGGAALDVFHAEPLPEDSPLWDMENVLITPHLAGQLPDYNRAALELFVHNLRAFRAGGPLPTGVDLDRQY